MRKIAVCPHCNKELSLSGMTGHLKFKHQVVATKAILEDSVKAYTAKALKSGTIEDPVKLKAELTAKLTDIATLHDEIAKLASIEHEQNVVRETLKGLTREGYVQLGESLGYVEQPTETTLLDSVPVADSKVETKPPETETKEPKAEIAPLAPLATTVPLADQNPEEPPSETEYDKFWRELNESLSKE